jgi:hypothetical protein
MVEQRIKMGAIMPKNTGFETAGGALKSISFIPGIALVTISYLF